MYKRYDFTVTDVILLAAAVSMDGFAAALGMGGSGITIPFRSSLIISFTGTFFLGVSVALGGIVKNAIPGTVCTAVSFTLLMLLGIFDLLKDVFKKIISKRRKGSNETAILLFDETAADKDNSKSISAAEAVTLSIALSADSAVTGISAGLGNIFLPFLLAVTFAAGLISVTVGQIIGRKANSLIKADTGKLCGIILILLAFSRLKRSV